MRALALGLGILALALAACAPSIRMLHQSNVYFERCSTMDLDARATAKQRRGCWAAWREYYSDAQPPERLGYADERLRVLDGKPAIDAGDRPAELAITNPTAPPAQTPDAGMGNAPAPAQDGGAGSVTDGGAPPAAPSRSAPCTPACEEGRANCAARCPIDTPACVAACDADRDLCIQGCP